MEMTNLEIESISNIISERLDVEYKSKFKNSILYKQYLDYKEFHDNMQEKYDLYHASLMSISVLNQPYSEYNVFFKWKKQNNIKTLGIQDIKDILKVILKNKKSISIDSIINEAIKIIKK
jgi:hypothetical protein